MELLIVATPMYNDPHAQEWQPDLRYSVGFLRRQELDVGFAYCPSLDNPAALLSAVQSSQPKALYVELSEENREPVMLFVQRFRALHRNVSLLVGGIPATLQCAELLEQAPGIDFIVTGERELPLLELGKRVRSGQTTARVPGLQSSAFRTQQLAPIVNLDDLGPMATDGLAELTSRQPPEARVGYLIGSRGCYARCSFCGVPGYYANAAGRPWRAKSAITVVDELQGLADDYGIRRFVFQDYDFLGPGPRGQERARQIAAEILRRELDLEYHFCCRLNDVRADTMALLKQSGLAGIGVSVESVNQESLDLFRKGLRAEAIDPTLSLLESLQIPCEVNMIFFDPYLTLDGVRRNLALIDRLARSQYLTYSDAFPLNELRAFSWSPVAQRLTREGLLDSEWSCRYRDPRVAQLVAFVQRLRSHLPISFKTRLPFDATGSSAEAAPDSGGPADVPWLASGLRHWVGLVLLPRYVGAACDVLEVGSNSEDRIDQLDENFQNELAVLRDAAKAFASTEELL